MFYHFCFALLLVVSSNGQRLDFGPESRSASGKAIKNPISSANDAIDNLLPPTNVHNELLPNEDDVQPEVTDISSNDNGLSPNENVTPPHDDNAPANDNEIPPKDDMFPSNDEEITPNDNVTPPRDDEIRLNEDVTSSNDKELPPNDDEIPSNENVIPSNDNELPPIKNVTPSNDNELPLNENVTQPNDNELPPNKNVTPSNDNELPLNENVTPSDDNELPSNENVTPSNDHELPSNENVTPNDNAPSTSVNEEHPGNSNKPSGLRDFVCERRFGYYSINGKCDLYIECREFRPVRRLCPDGMHFNKKARWPEYPCGYPSDVQCRGRSTQQPARPTSECPHQFGFFPINNENPRERCGKYLMCAAGTGSVMDCPFALVFDPVTRRCDWPELVPSCKDYLGFKCPASILDEYYDGSIEDLDEVQNYKYEGECSYFWSCRRGEARVLRCDYGLAFDPDSRRCIDEKLVQCLDKKVESKEIEDKKNESKEDESKEFENKEEPFLKPEATIGSSA